MDNARYNTIGLFVAMIFKFRHFILHCNEHNPRKYSECDTNHKRQMDFTQFTALVQYRICAHSSKFKDVQIHTRSITLFSFTFCNTHTMVSIHKNSLEYKNCFQLICHQSISMR